MAKKIADERKILKTLVTRTLRHKLSFSVIKSAVLCIRRTRTHKREVTPLADLEMKETCLRVDDE